MKMMHSSRVSIGHALWLVSASKNTSPINLWLGGSIGGCVPSLAEESCAGGCLFWDVEKGILGCGLCLAVSLPFSPCPCAMPSSIRNTQHLSAPFEGCGKSGPCLRVGGTDCCHHRGQEPGSGTCLKINSRFAWLWEGGLTGRERKLRLSNSQKPPGPFPAASHTRASLDFFQSGNDSRVQLPETTPLLLIASVLP